MARKKQTTQAVIGYCRVSTEDQAGSGVSLDAQRHRIEAATLRRGPVLETMEEIDPATPSHRIDPQTYLTL